MFRRRFLALWVAPLFAPAVRGADSPAILLELERARRERAGVVPPPAPAKVSVAGPKYDPDHRCDHCGYESPRGEGTWIITGFRGDGGHTHKCPRCGTVWHHGGHTHAEESPPSVTYTLPQASGCANGNCPSPSRGRGLFRR